MKTVTEIKEVRDLLYEVSAYDAILKRGAESELRLIVTEKSGKEGGTGEDFDLEFTEDETVDFITRLEEKARKRLEELGVKI